MVKEFNECVMESVEEPCSRLIFRPLTKPLGSKLSHNQMATGQAPVCSHKGGLTLVQVCIIHVVIIPIISVKKCVLSSPEINQCSCWTNFSLELSCYVVKLTVLIKMEALEP